MYMCQPALATQQQQLHWPSCYRDRNPEPFKICLSTFSQALDQYQILGTSTACPLKLFAVATLELALCVVLCMGFSGFALQHVFLNSRSVWCRLSGPVLWCTAAVLAGMRVALGPVLTPLVVPVYTSTTSSLKGLPRILPTCTAALTVLYILAISCTTPSRRYNASTACGQGIHSSDDSTA